MSHGESVLRGLQPPACGFCNCKNSTITECLSMGCDKLSAVCTVFAVRVSSGLNPSPAATQTHAHASYTYIARSKARDYNTHNMTEYTHAGAGCGCTHGLIICD